MLILAKDKETSVETIWFRCSDKKLATDVMEVAANASKTRWTYRMVEDQPYSRVEGRDPVWRIAAT